MTNLAKSNGVESVDIERVLIGGDLGKLTTDQRMSYVGKVCESLGLNPLTRPFQFLSLQGKTVLYASKDCTDQLRKINGVSIAIVSRETIEGVYIVTARATDKSGRSDEDTGALSIAGLKGDALANAMMKCSTKAKRRVTLSICGLGMIDESEVDSIPSAHRLAYDADTGESLDEHPFSDDQMATARAQAESKAIDDKWVDAEMKPMLAELGSGEDFLKWVVNHGNEYTKLTPNAKGRLRTAMANTAKRLDVGDADVIEAIDESKMRAKAEEDQGL